MPEKPFEYRRGERRAGRKPVKERKGMKKFKQLLCGLLAAALLVCALPAATAEGGPQGQWKDYAAGAFAGGAGTQGEPYRIETAEQLAKLAADVAAGSNYNGTYFLLCENIDLSAHRWNPIGSYIWQQSGSTTVKAFGGIFDGGGHTITGMYVDERESGSAAGLFGRISSNEQQGTSVPSPAVKNLTVTGATVYASSTGMQETSSGILVGFCSANKGLAVQFENIAVSGTVVNEMGDTNCVSGGLAGYVTRGAFKNCRAENIAVSGGVNSGGFVGMDTQCTFEGCTASGTLQGGWALGGFTGYSTSAALQDASTASAFTRCLADVHVTASDWRAGGFAGWAECGVFQNCAALGDVTSEVSGWQPKAGGFAGELGADARVAASHAAGAVTGSNPDIPAGGFLGLDAGGTTEECSFDGEKNAALAAVGETDTGGTHDIAKAGTAGALAGICRDYYGGHAWGAQPVVDKQPTCGAPGSQSVRCTRCGQSQPGSQQAIAATGRHSYENGKCTVCGAAQPGQGAGEGAAPAPA